MVDEVRAQTSPDPAELWRRWNDTTTRMWSSILDSSNDAYSDPFGFYRLWSKSIGAAQGSANAGMPAVLNPLEIWKQWVEATTEAWQRAAAAQQDAVELSGKWLQVLEQTRMKIVSGEISAQDPITFFKQWYDATSELWAQVIGEVMSSERFMEANRQFIETYTGAVKAANRINEELFQSLQLPTRSDIARVAGLVVSLEEKVDKIEDDLEDVAAAAKDESTGKAVDNLSARLQRIEGKLNDSTTHAVESLSARLQRVEDKLDTLLNALEQREEQQQAEAVKPRAAVRRKASKGAGSQGPGSTEGAK